MFSAPGDIMGTFLTFEEWPLLYLDTDIAVTARALTLGVKNDCKSMSVKLRYWIFNIIQRDTARPLVSRLHFERSFT